MNPSNSDTGGSADLPDEPDLDEAGLDLDEGGIDLDEDEDGLAPEAGRRRPSVLSVLLLVAGAIWIVVALLKIGEGPSTGAPPAAIADTGDTLASLPSPEPDDPVPEPGLSPPDGQHPAQPANSAENGGIVENPDAELGPGDGNPASERGPPEGSLLAGKRWPQDYAAPEVVHYTIKRGGSMKIVANLYKIFHHEMESLNPGIELDRELPPSTRLVVYRQKPGISSESVGFPGHGSVEGAMPMVDGPGRILRHTPWKAWATRTTVATLDVVLREWARRYPNAQPIIVGNMSARKGGRLPPHSSHQSGRDIDLSYPQIWDGSSELAPQVMNERNLDRDLTWNLLELLRETGAIELIFIDSKLQRLLYEHALETGRYSKKQLENWMEYPRTPGSGSPIIQHVRGHVDHMHVRLRCRKAETRCESRPH